MIPSFKENGWKKTRTQPRRRDRVRLSVHRGWTERHTRPTRAHTRHSADKTSRVMESRHGTDLQGSTLCMEDSFLRLNSCCIRNLALFSVGPILKFIFGLRDRKAYKKNTYQYSYTKITRNSFNNSTVTLSYQSGISPSPPPWKKSCKISTGYHLTFTKTIKIWPRCTHLLPTNGEEEDNLIKRTQSEK